MNVAFFKRALKSKKISQEQFANDIGIGYATLKKYFNGKSSPTIEIFKKMCDYFEVDMGYALNGKDEIPYEFQRKYWGILGMLKEMGCTTFCNPKNEDEIYIKTAEGDEIHTSMDVLTERIHEIVRFELYRLSKNE